MQLDRALSGVTIPGQSGPGSNDNEGVLRIPQSSSIAGTSPSDCFVSYSRHSFGGIGGGVYPSAEVQSVYSTAPADWAMKELCWSELLILIANTLNHLTMCK